MAKKIVAKKAVIKKAPAKKAAPKKAAPKKTVQKIVKKAAPVKAAPKKTVAKKATSAVRLPSPKAPVQHKPTFIVASGGEAFTGPAAIPEQIRDAAIKVLEERQAEDILVVDLHNVSPMADYAIIATCRSARQSAAVADYLRSEIEPLGAPSFNIEGAQQGDWVLIDAGDVIIHLFRPEVRNFYAIEQIWSAKKTTPRAGA